MPPCNKEAGVVIAEEPRRVDLHGSTIGSGDYTPVVYHPPDGERVTRSTAVRNIGSGSAVTVQPGRAIGQIDLSGAKNSALRLLAASLLSPTDLRLDRFPSSLLDVQVHIGMLKRLGKEVTCGDDWCQIREVSAATDLAWETRSIRNTLLIMGAMLARHGSASVPLPGGCEIGERPYDIHLDLFRALGARISVEDGRLFGEAPPAGLSGGVFESRIQSTGVTENAILCGALIPDGVELINPHLTPEVVDLIRFVVAGGAHVELVGNSRLKIYGSASFAPPYWRVMPDRMEAMTWAAMAVATRGDVEIRGFPVSDNRIALEYLSAAGAQIFYGDNSVIVRSRGPLPVAISAGSHPAVHSDMQPLFGALAALAEGTSEIIDLRYPDRFAYLTQLQLMGASCEFAEGRARIVGSGRLHGAEVEAVDLRAGAALLVAAVGATSPTKIESYWQIERGYDQLGSKLQSLGLHVDE